MGDGIIHHIVVGTELANNESKFTFQVGFLYDKRSLKIVRIEEEYINNKTWFFIYVIKLKDKDGVEFLWDKISNDNVKVQYDLKYDEL